MDDRVPLLVIRPQRQTADFAADLERRLPGRFRVVAAPVIRIVPAGDAPDLRGIGALAFTSANGVEQFAARTSRRDLPAYCVGEITADTAVAAGFAARSADGDVAALASLIAAGHRGKPGDVLHVRGRHAAGDLIGQLAVAGVPARAAEIYDQVALPIDGQAARLLAARSPRVVGLFSPRTARLFADQARAEGWETAHLTTVALSAAADSELAPLAAARRIVAARPTREAMIAALEDA
jgi:uroporphyrinogen-III synthase